MLAGKKLSIGKGGLFPRASLAMSSRIITTRVDHKQMQSKFLRLEHYMCIVIFFIYFDPRVIVIY